MACSLFLAGDCPPGQGRYELNPQNEANCCLLAVEQGDILIGEEKKTEDIH